MKYKTLDCDRYSVHPPTVLIFPTLRSPRSRVLISISGGADDNSQHTGHVAKLIVQDCLFVSFVKNTLKRENCHGLKHSIQLNNRTVQSGTVLVKGGVPAFRRIENEKTEQQIDNNTVSIHAGSRKAVGGGSALLVLHIKREPLIQPIVVTMSICYCNI
jgi:hypothetical protein